MSHQSCRLLQLYNQKPGCCSLHKYLHKYHPRVIIYLSTRYLVLDTKQRSLSLTGEGMALLLTALADTPGVTFRCVGVSVPQN